LEQQVAARPIVLLVDDEVLIRDLVQESLEEAGFAVVPLGAGAEAIERLQDGDAFCALVTDINFGAPPGGWEVATSARELSPAIAIVYMTGDSAHEWSAHGVPNSVVIAKPFAPSQIVVALASLLNRTDGLA
jgi:CheY-like chemotaxis protein